MGPGRQGLVPSERPTGDVLLVEHVVVEQGGFRLEAGGIQVAAGARLGLVGRNGCGKTTLLEACVGLRRTRVGRVWLLGAPLQEAMRDPGLRRQWGCQLQSSSFSRYNRVCELLDLHRAMYGRACPRLHGLLQLDELRPLLAGTLSRGQRQRVELFLALAHAPRIAFLDEPMTGLDRRFADALAGYVAGPELAATALVVVGHAREELALLDQVAWMDAGHVLDFGEPGALVRTHLGQRRLRLTLGSATAADAAERTCRVLAVGRVIREAESVVCLYGAEDMPDRAVAAVPPAELLSIETGRCGVEDLVRLGQPQATLLREVA